MKSAKRQSRPRNGVHLRMSRIPVGNSKGFWLYNEEEPSGYTSVFWETKQKTGAYFGYQRWYHREVRRLRNGPGKLHVRYHGGR